MGLTSTRGSLLFLRFKTAKITSSRGFKVDFKAEGNPIKSGPFIEVDVSDIRTYPQTSTTTTTATTTPITTTASSTTTRAATTVSTTTTKKTKSTTPGVTMPTTSYTPPSRLKTYQIKCGVQRQLDNIRSGYITSPGYGKMYPSNCNGGYILKKIRGVSICSVHLSWLFIPIECLLLNCYAAIRTTDKQLHIFRETICMFSIYCGIFRASFTG